MTVGSNSTLRSLTLTNPWVTVARIQFEFEMFAL